MMRLLPSILLLAFFLPSIGQNSNLTLVYHLSNEDYEQKIRKDTFKLLPSDCKLLVGKRDTLDDLEPGYYINAWVREEQLYLSLEDNTSISAVVLNNDRDFAVQVLDTAGQLLNAKVWLNNKAIKYDVITKSYRLPKHKKGGLLKVEASGQMVYYEVSKENTHRDNQYFKQTPFGYYITTPVRWGKNVYHYFKRGFEYNNWRIYRLQNIFRKKEKSFKGYIALNKPIYRHGDTLQLKAYVADYKGKPWQKDIRLRITGNKFSKSETLRPDKNGSVVYNMVIGDSLTLDQNYYIYISDVSDDYNDLLHNFKLEDYQLDEIDYRFSSSQPAYQKGEKIILLAEGKDKNGFPIPEGEVKIIATRGSVENSDATEIRVPDTLWVHTQVLDTHGETQLIFPDRLLPDAALDIRLQATFTNSNGELQEKVINVKYVSLWGYIKIELQNGYIVANYIEGNKSVPSTAQLEMVGRENIYTKKTINLPFKEKLHPLVNYYTITIDKDIGKRFNLYSEDAEITESGVYIKDSIFVIINNPHQILINYWIYRGENIIAEGQTEEAQFLWHQEDKSHKPYRVRYQYLWAGESEYKEITTQSYEKMLNIKVDQPQKVIPGASVQVQVKVSDQKNNYLQGVNLTAGAVNAQFNSIGSFSEIKIDYKNVKPLRRYGNFNANRKEDFDNKYPITKEWYEKFSLQDQLYYQLRFSEKPIYTHYDTLARDSFYKNIAQFAPYIVNKGLSEPIIMIYCNQKLVYYYEADNNIPYSFVGKEGYNLITIRTPKYEYWINNVVLKKGQKLEFAVDENVFSQDSSIHRKTMPDSLTAIERKLLKNKMLLLKNPLPFASYYLWQDSSAIHAFELTTYNKEQYSFPIIIGPFNTSRYINYVQQNGFAKSFNFEPGFSYNIIPKRERLYESLHFDQKILLPKTLNPKSIRQIIINPSDIHYTTPRSSIPINIPLQSYFNNQVKKGGGYQFFYRPNNRKNIIALALMNDSSSEIAHYDYNVKTFNSLRPGNYSLIFVNNAYEIYQQKIEIQANVLLIQNLNTVYWQKDTAGVVEKIFYKAPAVIIKEDIGWKEQYDIPSAFSFRNVIQGHILDEYGEPLIGANVLIKGTLIGAATDIDGYYSITLPAHLEDPTIVVSYTGYNTKEIGVDNNSIEDVILDTSAALSEVVVTGYGIRRTKITTGIADISALQGRAAGLDITSDNIQVRGLRSLGENYYIDGMRINNNSKNKLDLFTPELLQTNGIRSNFRDYAYWQPNLITDHNGEAYFTVTYPDDITSWNTFVLGMDRKLRAGVAYGNTKSYKPLIAQLAMPRFLIEGDETDIIGKAINYTNDTLTVQTSFKMGEQLLQENQWNVINGITEKMKTTAPAQKDSIQATYELKMGEYVDGEQRSIPIFRRGMEDTKGYFYVLNNDTSFTITPLLSSGNLEVYVEGKMLDNILRDIMYLKNYKYGCNEQTASRLLASIMEKKITEQVGVKYVENDNIIKLVERLERTQNKDGSWGWWAGNDWNHWMTIYVTSALQEAKKAGFSSTALNKGLDFIIHHTEALNRQNLIYSLQILAESETPFDFETPLVKLDTTQLDLYERFMTIRIKQKLGRDYSLDSIYHYQQKNTFGSVFWEQPNAYWYSYTLYPTLLAYEILKAAGKKEQLPFIRQYFFQQKTSLYWGSTFKTAHVLQTILPDMLEETPLSDIKNEYCVINGNKITNFPYRANYTANQDLTIIKSGKTPLFFTAYQHFFNTKPTNKADLFSITSTLYQNNKPTTYLQQGEKATLKVEVEIKAKAEYVMIEIPIPASCSYAEKPNGWHFPEVHREYFKEKTAIFCQELPKGKYEFSIELEPRFTGTYTLNPVKVEQMYFPVFNGNNEMKQVVIKNEE